MPDALAILEGVALKYIRDDVWTDSRFEFIRSFSPPVKGAIGERYADRMCGEAGLKQELPVGPDGRVRRNLPWDIRIEGHTFDIKTATVDVNGNFQFNNIREKQRYGALLVFGILPSDVLMQAWTQDYVTAGRAGRTVPMSVDAPDLRKLTVDVGDRLPMDKFRETVLGVTMEMDRDKAVDRGPKTPSKSRGMTI